MKKSSRSDFQYERGESLFSLLLSSSASSSAQVLLNYYGAVAVCIRGELCDRSTICEAVVPQIASLQSTIARAADVSSPIVGSPAADKGRWTEADRLLGACQS